MARRSFLAVCATVVLTFLTTSVSISAQTSVVRSDIERSFSRFELVKIALPSTAVGEGPRREIEIPTAGRNFRLLIEANDLRAPHFRAEDEGPNGTTGLGRSPVTTFKGSIDGEQGSQVRLSIEGSRIEGFFSAGGERYFIEPAKKYSDHARDDESVIYRAVDSKITDSFWCHSDIPTRIRYGKGIVADQDAALVQTVRRIDLATEADSQYVAQFGGATQANNEILSILNMVEGTYSTELSLTIRVVFQHTWSVTDPFGGANTNEILTNFRNYWNSTYPTISNPRSAAHLFTAKSNALSQGFAYLSVICNNPQAAYGLSGYISWAPGKYLITAHELGHNLGANHADAGQSCSNTLMNTQLSGSTPMTFCSYSRTEISNFLVGSGYCLAPVLDPEFDFDGDRKADISVFRPSNGAWYLNQSQDGFRAFSFGTNGDRPVAGDYDGDGKSDAAIYRNGVWWRLLSMTSTVDVIGFGLAEDIPVPADFDGDGRTDIAVFRPSNGVWYRLASSDGSFAAISFGLNGDIPVAGDYSGDGKADVNVFRPSNGVWYRLNSGNGNFVAIPFGTQGDIPVGADLDGDGRYDRAVFRPSNGVWYVTQSSNAAFYAVAFGLSGDIPSPADFDGDGKSDIAVFRPADGVWYRLNSSNGAFNAIQFGLSGDRPVPSKQQ